jgi:hypothetical protein
VFNTVSIVTTTGFASADFALWSATATHLLFLGMFLGAMVGSTTCSIKTLRWVIVAKTVSRQLFLAVNPRAVRPVRLDGQPIDEEIIPDALVFVLLSIVLVLLLTVVIVLDAARAGAAVSEFEALGAACGGGRQRVRGAGCGGGDVPQHRPRLRGRRAVRLVSRLPHADEGRDDRADVGRPDRDHPGARARDTDLLAVT